MQCFQTEVYKQVGIVETVQRLKVTLQASLEKPSLLGTGTLKCPISESELEPHTSPLRSTMHTTHKGPVAYPSLQSPIHRATPNGLVWKNLCSVAGMGFFVIFWNPHAGIWRKIELNYIETWRNMQMNKGTKKDNQREREREGERSQKYAKTKSRVDLRSNEASKEARKEQPNTFSSGST